MSLGPTLRFPSNGPIAPITSGKAVASRTLEALRSFDPDVVHLHEPFSPGANVAVLVGTEVPTIGTFHASFPRAQRLVRRVPPPAATDGRAHGRAHRGVRRSTPQRRGNLRGPVRHPRERRRPPIVRDAAPWPSERPAIFFVGRHEPRKGLATLLDAFAGLDTDAVLWVAGTGPQTAALRARGDRGVEWLGTISEEEKARRLRGATVACFPSMGESFGVVLLEAMAAGAAVVASDLTGYRDVARSEREALLVPVGDAVSVRAALERLLGDATMRTALVEAGHRRAEEFGMQALAQEFLERYETAIRVTAEGPEATARIAPL